MLSPYREQSVNLRPKLHVCNWMCTVMCLLGAHRQDNLESKCMCCHRFNRGAAHELARSGRSEGITLEWWRSGDTDVPDVSEVALEARMRRLEECLRQ
jgi:hypothetical protein